MSYFPLWYVETLCGIVFAGLVGIVGIARNGLRLTAGAINIHDSPITICE